MLVLIPILAMLALEFIIPGKSPLGAKPLLIILAGSLLCFTVVRSILPDNWIYPEGEAVTRVCAQVDHLLSKKNWQKKPVIILEGSSATAYGINGALLEELLAVQGIDATVLQFSLSGANHFERIWMLELFLKKIGAQHREELKNAPAILLSEVFNAYDQDPLYLFQKEAYSHRAITWASPSIVLAAWSATRSYPWILFEHLMLNRFAVGIFSSMQPLNYKRKENAFFALTGKNKKFHYDETKKAFEEATAMYTADQEFKGTVPSAGWISYYQELQQQLKNIIRVGGFYALPTLQIEYRNYQLAFLNARPAGTVMIGPASLSFMKQLMQEDNWYDDVHIKNKCSVLFAEWLAKEIVKKWPALTK